MTAPTPRTDTAPAPSRWTAIVFSVAVVAAVVLWIATGGGLAERVYRPAPYLPADDSQPVARTVSVRVADSAAELHRRAVTVSGWTSASRIVPVRAEVAGRIAAFGADKGEPIAEGALLARIAMGEREARRREARAAVERWSLEYEAAQRLSERGYNARSTLANALASLESARTALALVEKEIEDTTIVAPFAGVLERRDMELGQVVSIGDTVGVIADLDPIVVRGRVSERDRSDVAAATAGRARFLDGTTREGRIRYLSAVADAHTRSYEVELELDNADRALVVGLTAELTIPATSVEAHFVPGSILTLDADGELGVKLLGEDGKIAFAPVEIVAQRRRGVLVTGLPATCRVVVAGQELAAPGDSVDATSVGTMRDYVGAAD